MTERPRIEPAVLASLIETVPARVRNRLDKNPTVAEAWNWKRDENGFQIQAGDELVEIDAADGLIRELARVRCSCLLSPKCFHVLACLSILSTKATEIATEQAASTASPGVLADGESGGQMQVAKVACDVAPTGEMIRAGRHVRDAVAGILRVGARASGALVQSGLLRAGHDCRAAGLPLLGNTVLRIAEEVRRLRAQSDLADSASLRQDLFAALQAVEWLHRSDRETDADAPDRSASHGPPPRPLSNVPRPWILGPGRREFQPVPVSRLAGWFAEPILTRSGYAGVCLHLLAPDGRLHQVIESRPGDSQLVLQAYLGGIDLGTLAMPGRTLCRQTLVVQDLVASADGRLGKGKATRWAVSSDARLSALAETRFSQPASEQLESVFRAAGEPAESRRGGWDLVALEAQVIGPSGPAILARVEGQAQPWRLRIAVDDPALPFRDNLQLLARCPGLRFRWIGRVRIDSAGDVDLLAIGPPREDQVIGEAQDASPRLQLPDEWRNVCNVGLDRLERHHVAGTTRWAVEVTLAGREFPAADDGLGELDRRLTAVALGGHRALPRIDSQAHRRDMAALLGRNQSTAATLLDALAMAGSTLSLTVAAGTQRQRTAAAFDTALLAGATYVQAARRAFHRQRWQQLVSD